MEDIILKVKKKSDDLIGLLGFSGEAIVVSKDEVIFANFQVEDPALLIGRGGEGIEALEHVLRLLLYADLQEAGTNVVADVAGYRNKKGEYIAENAREKAYSVLSTGIAETLPPMSAFERRIVHLTCANIADVETESEGERQDRRVVIKPKKTQK